MESSRLTICLQKKNHLIHTYALLGMGMGIALIILFSSIALLPMTALIEIAGAMISIYLSTGIILYYYLEIKLNHAKENALLLAVCQKMMTEFLPTLNENQLLAQLKKMFAGQLTRHARIRLLKHYLAHQQDLETLTLSLIQNEAEGEILMNLGLRWGTQLQRSEAHCR